MWALFQPSRGIWPRGFLSRAYCAKLIKGEGLWWKEGVGSQSVPVWNNPGPPHQHPVYFPRLLGTPGLHYLKGHLSRSISGQHRVRPSAFGAQRASLSSCRGGGCGFSGAAQPPSGPLQVWPCHRAADLPARHHLHPGSHSKDAGACHKRHHLALERATLLVISQMSLAQGLRLAFDK